MGVVRTIVFPALRLLVWGLIAVALLYIAFGRGGPEEAGAASPSAVLTPAETTVSRGDVVNTVSLSGSIQADPSTTVKATAAGTVGRVRATAGDTVEKGTPLFTVVVPVEETAPAVTTDPAAPAPAPAAPRTRTVTVTATVPGTLATLDVLAAQPVSIGDAVATVSPGTLTVSAPLTQDQQFRLLAAPSSASVTVPGGPGTFECTDLRTGIPVADAPAPAPVQPDPYAYGGGADPGSTPTGATVTCRVPADVQVFPGLSATVEVTAGRAAGVLLAPVTAVQGRVAKGSLWRLDDTGAPTETPVTLGLTDGEFVEVKGGVEEGARILQFVPGTDEIAPGDDGTVVYG
ncbi:efflux RND transporter periplasmic adaptor subunit [Kineococcus rubinsiae]|uniref:efflux RND transporter periplasmic adaptor subunit n=1 Tax=Kineococcus rubinsiae TaxID=2609562 RepID=UPI001430D469|nr:efflux RND transporter periplasmic adaptor subunit [Kineococcus rubinsiae]NIZ93633.1 efflux RND transporter periplasmic adaptor subunit [Kineococcus rubinsiae]